jgi:acylphosphatase
MIAQHLVIRGRVQGVGYRYAMTEVAETLGVTGWVRNRRDGTVEAWVQGDDASVERAIAWARRGPASARVDQVDVDDVTPDPALRDFRQRPSA